MRLLIILWSLICAEGQLTFNPTTRGPTTRSPTTSAPTPPTSSPTVTPAIPSVKVYGGFRRDLANISTTTFDRLKGDPTVLPLFPYNSLESTCLGLQLASVCTVVLSGNTSANLTSKINQLSSQVYRFMAGATPIDIAQTPAVTISNFQVYGRQNPTSDVNVSYSNSISLPTSTYYLGRIIKKAGVLNTSVCIAAKNSVNCTCECSTILLENELWMTLSTSCQTAVFNEARFLSNLTLTAQQITEGPAILPVTAPRSFGIEFGGGNVTYAIVRNKTIRVSDTGTPLRSVVVSQTDLIGPNSTDQFFVWGRPATPRGWNGADTNSFRIIPVTGGEVVTVIFASTDPRVMTCSLNIIPGVSNTNLSCIVGVQFTVSIVCNASNGGACGSSHIFGNSSQPVELVCAGPGLCTSYPSPQHTFFQNSMPGIPTLFELTTASFVHRIRLSSVEMMNVTFWGQNNQSLPLDVSGDFVQFNASVFKFTFPLAKNFTVIATCNSPPCGFSLKHIDENLVTEQQTGLQSGARSMVFQQSVTPVHIQLESSVVFTYIFTPYIRSFANIPFRVSQFNSSDSFSEYPPFFDSLTTTYSKTISQYFTFSVEIFHCAGANPPCLYYYTFGNFSGVGSSGISSVVLKMPSPSDSSLNFTAPLVITSGDGTGTYTFNLRLARNCQDGYFFSSVKEPVRCPSVFERQEACCTCPEHATCHDPLQAPRPEAGYVKGSQVWDMVKCDPPQACVEGGQCALGYKNAEAACSQCQTDPPHFRVNRFCEECPTYTVFVAVVGFLLFLCALALFVKISKPDHTKKFTLPIALGYAQIISIFVTFQVPWPPIVLGLFDVFSFLNFNVDLFSPECAVPVSFFSKWLFKIFLPVITLGIFAIVYVTVLFVPRARNLYVSFLLWDMEDIYDNFLRRKSKRMTFDTDEKQQQHEAAMNVLQQNEAEWHQARIEWEETHLEDRFINALVTAATIGYTFIAKTASEPLNCVGQPGGAKMYVRADPAAYCYEGEWFTYQALSILFTILYTAGIPIFFAYLLIRAKKNNYLHEQAFYYRYGHLVLPYRAQFWYWELVQLLRKLITIQLIEFFYSLSGKSLAQVNSVLITLIVFLALQEFLKPYEFTWCNRVAFCWNIASVLVLCSALLFDLGLEPDGSTLYGIALVIVCAFTLGVSIYAFLLENRRSRARKALFNGTTMLTREREERELLLSLFGARLGNSLHRKTRDLLVDDRTLLYAKLKAWASNTSTGVAIAEATMSTLEMMPFENMPVVEQRLTPREQSFDTDTEPKVPPPLPAKHLTPRGPPPVPKLHQPKPPPEPRRPIDDPPRRPVRLSQYSRTSHLAEIVKTPVPPPRAPRRQFPGIKRLASGDGGFTEMKQL